MKNVNTSTPSPKSSKDAASAFCKVDFESSAFFVPPLSGLVAPAQGLNVAARMTFQLRFFFDPQWKSCFFDALLPLHTVRKG